MEHPNIFSDGCPQSTEGPKMNNGKVGIKSSLYFFSTHEKACEAGNWNSTPCHWFQSIWKVTQHGITSGWKQTYDLRRPKKNMTFRTPRSMLESVKHFSKLLNVLKSEQHNTEAKVLNHSLAKYLPFQKMELTDAPTTGCSQQRLLKIQDSIPSDSNRASFQAPARAAAFTSSERRSGEWWWRRPVASVNWGDELWNKKTSSFILKHLKLEMPRTEIYHPYPLALESTFPSVLLCLESIIVDIHINLYTVHQYFVHPNHSIPV